MLNTTIQNSQLPAQAPIPLSVGRPLRSAIIDILALFSRRVTRRTFQWSMHIRCDSWKGPCTHETHLPKRHLSLKNYVRPTGNVISLCNYAGSPVSPRQLPEPRSRPRAEPAGISISTDIDRHAQRKPSPKSLLAQTA